MMQIVQSTAAGESPMAATGLASSRRRSDRLGRTIGCQVGTQNFFDLELERA